MSSTDFDLSYVHALHTKFYSSHPTLGSESSSSSSTSSSSSSASSTSTTTSRPHTAQALAAPVVQDHNAMSRLSTQPISIPQQPSQQDLNNVERRRGADTPEIFRSVDWEPSRMESLKRASSAGPSQSANTKVKAQKENAIFRKTSQKYGKLRALKDSYLHGGRVQRPSGGDLMEGVEGSAVLPEHATSSAAHHKGIQRFYPSNRLIQSLKAPRHDTPQPVNRPSPTLSSSSTMSYPDQYPQQYFTPQMPADISGGDAARRAAAQTSNNRVRYVPKYQASRDIARSRIGSIPGASDSGADLASSGDVEMMDAVEPEILTTTSGLNPVEALPTEIVALIFSHLDASSLKTCQRVAKSWTRIAVDPLIWRDQYLQQYQRRTYVAPAPIQIGGIGVGIPNQPLQDWELMHDARKRIDKNWARGDLGAKGIYLAGHTDSVYCVQFDEQKIITGSRDRTIRVWDINTYKCIKVIGGPNVRPVPGPKQLRTVEYPKFYHAEPSVNGTAYGNNIYHVPSDFHSASILCLQYDHEILVTGSSDNDLLVWDVNTYEPLRRLKQHTGGVLDVAFDEKHIVSCSKDCTIIVWDRKTLEPIRTLTGHRGPVNAVQLRGNLLVSASGDGVARLWDLSKMQCVREFPQKERGLAAVEFSDDAKYVLAGGNDHITYKFDVATGAEVKTFTGHTQLVRSLFLDTQNRRVVSGSYDLDLRVYDYDTGALLGRFNEWTTSWMLAAKCDYRRIVSTSQDGRILMIDFGRDLNGQVIPGVELLKGVESL